MKESEAKNAEVKIGEEYFATLSEAIQSLKDKEDKTAEIEILVDSVKLENFATILGWKYGDSHTIYSDYDITFVGYGKDKTIIDVSTDNNNKDGNHHNYVEGANLSFKDVTVKIGDSSNYQGFIRAGKLSFDGCRFIGMGCNWGTENVFTNCLFDDGDAENKDFYHAWLYNEGKYTFEDCTFETKNGKFLHLYNEDETGRSLEVKLQNCTFKCPQDAPFKKAALNIKKQALHVFLGDEALTDGIERYLTRVKKYSSLR